MLLGNMLEANLQSCMVFLSILAPDRDFFELLPQLIEPVVSISLDLDDTHQLHFVLLHLCEYLFVELLESLALCEVLSPLIIAFPKGEFQMVLLARKSVNEGLIRFDADALLIYGLLERLYLQCSAFSFCAGTVKLVLQVVGLSKFEIALL